MIQREVKLELRRAREKFVEWEKKFSIPNNIRILVKASPRWSLWAISRLRPK